MSDVVVIDSGDSVIVRRDRIEVVSIGIQGPPGQPGNGVQVFGETPAGSVNGSNATFTTAFNFVPESVAVSVNGLRQKRVDDYNTSGANTILMSVSPEAGTSILVDYLRA